MRRITPWLLGAALALGGTPAFAQDGTLNVYCWDAYFPVDQQEAFTEETGIEISYDVFDSNEMLETKLLTGASGYDVVCPNAVPHMKRMVETGLFQPLDRAALANLDNVNPRIAAQMDGVADPGNAHAVPWMWGSYAIGHVPEKIAERMDEAPTDSLAMIFDPEVVSRFADCGVDIVDASNDILALVLIYLGVDPTSQDPDDLTRAADHLAKIRPYVRQIHGSQYYGAMADGDVCLAIGYSGDFGIAQENASAAGQPFTIEYAIPEEGSIFFVDSWAIPSDAEDVEAAHAFIDFALRPEVAASATNQIFYANANAASTELIDEALREDPNMFPPPAMMERMRLSQPVDQGTRRLITRLWTRFRTGQ